MLPAIEEARIRVSKSTDAQRKSQLGQFLTPARTAQFMAELFPPTRGGVCRLVDPGAGIGSLASAFLERCGKGELVFDRIELTAYELDTLLHEDLNHSLLGYTGQTPLSYQIIGGDFIEEAINRIQFTFSAGFTHAIINPPYKKIGSNSRHRRLLRQVEIETVNLYSAFVALTLLLMAPGGQVVAITPRSFCNGPYYRPFRDFIRKRAAIRHLHLFETRDRAFQDDDVLQENIIVLLERGAQQGDVTVTTCKDDRFTDLVTHKYPYKQIVLPDDPEYFIHVPTSPERNVIELSPAMRYRLKDIGVQVSTGPVVDFRVKEHLRGMPETGTVPLLYPGHFYGYKIEWPKPGMKKANAIQRNAETEKWLYPNGFYCVVRRFSSKEERRRVVASVVQPEVLGGVDMVGFENHLNVFHEDKHGLPENLARGLVVYLNTTAVDEYFRRFNGHTQVNATDLILMKYPSREALIDLGEWAMGYEGDPPQAMIDKQLDKLNA